jgi:hypothetical protein
MKLNTILESKPGLLNHSSTAQGYNQQVYRSMFLNEENFQSFQDYLDKSGMTFEQLLDKLRSKEPDGVGGNAKFYRVPGTEFGVRELGSWGIPDTSPPKLVGTSDSFDGENFGQPVAHYGNNIQVLRLQHGSPAGRPYGKHRDDTRALQSYRKRILEAASLSDSAYERLIQQIIKINQKGYAMDPSKSGNLLIDPSSDRFNIVDLNQSEYKNHGGNIIHMLIDNYFFSKYELYLDPEMVKAGQQIINKVERSCDKIGLHLDKSNSSVSYSYNLTSGSFKPFVMPTKVDLTPANEVW